MNLDAEPTSGLPIGITESPRAFGMMTYKPWYGSLFLVGAIPIFKEEV
jgi:hypothetical protein